MGRFFATDSGDTNDGGGKFFDAGGRARTRGGSTPLTPGVADTPGEELYTAKLDNNKKKFAQGLIRLRDSGNWQEAARVFSQNRGVFSPEEIKALKLEDIANPNQKSIEYAISDGERSSGLGKAFNLGNTATGGALGLGLDLMDRPAQQVKLALGQVKQGKFKDAGSTLAMAIPRPGNLDAPLEYWTTNEVGDRIAASGLDQDGNKRLDNLREALGKDMNAGGRLLGAFDMAGSVALDPTTYLSFGGGSLAKAGMKTIAAEFGDDVARTIAENGLKGAVRKGLISEVEHEAIRLAMRRQAEELVTSAAAKRSVRRLVEREGAEGAAETLAERQMTAVARAGRSGMRVGLPIGDGAGARTVIPSRPFGKAIPGLQAKYAQRAVTAAGAAADVVDEAPVGAVDDVARASDEIMDAVRNAPAATDAGGYGPIVDRQLPQGTGVVSVDDGAGGKIIGIRGEDGALEGYLMATDDAINTFESLASTPGMGQRLLDAAQAEGLDVPRLLANSDFTDAGRASALKWLGKGDAPSPTLAHPSEIAFQNGDAFTDDFTFLGKADDGKDVFIQVNADDQLIPFQRNPKRIHVQPGEDGKEFTGGVRKGNVTFGELERGDRIPGVGVVKQVSDDGILRVFPDPSVLPPNADKWTLFPEGAADDAGRAADDVAPVDVPTVLRGGAGRTDPVRRSLGGVLKESRPGRALREAFIPRTGIRDALGETAAEKVYQAVEQASAAAGRNVNDMILQIGKVSAEAANELRQGAGPALLRVVPDLAGKEGQQAFNEIALGVLEGTLDATAVRAALVEDGMENAVKAVDAFTDVAERTGTMLDAAKGVEEGVVVNSQKGSAFGNGTTTRHGGEQYADDLFGTAQAPETGASLPRILTKEGEELAKGDASLGLAEILGVDSAQLRAGEDLSSQVNRAKPDVPGAQRYSDQTIRQVNADLVRRLGLPEDVKLFEDDAMAAVALRGKTAFEAAAQTDLYERLAKETVDGKNGMVLIARPGDSPLRKAQIKEQAQKNGWKPVKPNGKDPMIGEVFAHPEIADEVARVQDLLINDKSLKTMGEFLTKWNGVWASYATVPIVFGTGFHARNSIGNVILSFMGGLSNPVRFAEGADIQFSIGRTRALMKKEGIGWDEALLKAVKSERKRALITDMRAHGIISNGFFADLSGNELESLLRHKHWKDWLHASTAAKRIKEGTTNKGLLAGFQDNALIRSGRRVGDVVENNARVALYLDAFGKTGSVQQAANTVKKYLFDYGDLTPFERRYMKSLNRFYTFTRKNVAVQLYTLAHDPWRIKMVTQAEQNLYNGAETEGAPLPDYARKGGYNVAGILGKPAGTEGVAMNIDTPLDNAIRTLDPIVQAMSMTPGLRNVVPPEYRSNRMDLTKSVLNLRAGGPVEMLNFLYEQASGKDTFSGKDISKEGAGDTFKRLTTAFTPLYAKGAAAVDKPVWEEEMGMDLRLSLLKALVGVNVLPLTDKQKNQIAYVGGQEIENILEDMRAEGIDVPTYTDLVAAGLAPDMSAPRSTSGRRTAGQAAQEREDKINAARARYGAEPVQVQPRSSRRGGGRFFG